MKCLCVLMNGSGIWRLGRDIFTVPGLQDMHSRALPRDFSVPLACALGGGVAEQLRARGSCCFWRFYASLWPLHGRPYCLSRHNGVFQDLQTVSRDGIISLGNRRGELRPDH